MDGAKHVPEGDVSFRASMLRAVGGALGLVVLVAAVFGALGVLGRADEGPAVADGAAEEPADEDVAGPDDEPGAADEPAEDGTGTDEPEEPEPEEPQPEQPEEPDEPEPDEDESEGDEPQEDEPDERAFAPGDVTVQVLDGYQDDGGAAASGIAAALREEGYQVVAENPALRYEVTTVLWTPGFEDQARQVAAEIGAAEVREQPGNLSTQVQVHVVVGADQG